MSRELTIKQKKFVKRLVETGNATAAAREAYTVTSSASARSIGSQNLTNLNLRKAVETALRRSGLTIDFVSETIKDAMASGLGVKAKNSDSIRAAEILLKLHGAFPEKQGGNFLDVREEVKRMTYDEVKHEYQRVTRSIKEIMAFE